MFVGGKISINMDLKETVFFEYDLQTSTATQRLIPGNVEQGYVYLVVQKTTKFLSLFTIKHTETQLVEALHHKLECCGLDSL